MPDGRTSTPTPMFDVVLVGGGLQNALLALALLARRPGVRLAVVERAATLGGNHRWAFHAGDVPAAARPWMSPLTELTWPAYEVRFPGYARVVDAPYSSFDSTRLHAVVERAMSKASGCELLTGCAAERVDAHTVHLHDGRTLPAHLVVDARGPERLADAGVRFAGYQKFVGLEMTLAAPSGLARPCVMDATVRQADGFRFVYVLPLSARRVLVEDTYFSETSRLDRDAIRDALLAYCSGHGLEPSAVLREEHGILPLPSRLGAAPRCESPLVAGYQGGWFHPTTGYSLPAAVRVAELVARFDPGGPASAANRAAFRALVRTHRRQARFFAILNRMLFGWFADGERWHVLERFYRLPDDLIGRFYAMTTTRADRARIVCGRPPRGLSLGRAVASGLSA